MAKSKAGRKTVMTIETVNKLEEVFAIGGTDEEACFYANISKQTLYDYQKIHPEFIDRKEALKEKPILKARQTVVKSLDNLQDAKWYLEKKRKKEFGNAVDFTTGGEKISGFQFIKDDRNNTDNNSNGETKPSLGETAGQ